MEEAAHERGERLKALRAAAELSGATLEQDAAAAAAAGADGNGHEPPEKQDEEQDEEQALETADVVAPMRFRNYVPRDEELLKLKREAPVLPKFEDVIPKDTTEAPKTEADPIVSIAPKKSNWDLRRDISKKLEKLEKRTMRAIIELMPAEEKNRKQLESDDRTTEQVA